MQTVRRGYHEPDVLLSLYEQGDESRRDVLKAELALLTYEALSKLHEQISALQRETARSGARMLFASWSLVLATAGLVLVTILQST